jgi:hypothetical protein
MSHCVSLCLTSSHCVPLCATAEVADDLQDYLTSPSHPYKQDSPPGSLLTAKEVAFVSTCLADSSKHRPDVSTLLEQNPYLSSRYRGG